MWLVRVVSVWQAEASGTGHNTGAATSLQRGLIGTGCITSLVVCSCFDVCWSFGVAGWGGIRVAGWPLNILLPFTPGSYKLSLSFRFPHQNPVYISPLSPYMLHAPSISFFSIR